MTVSLEKKKMANFLPLESSMLEVKFEVPVSCEVEM